MTTHPLNDLSRQIIGAAIEVHRELGPGLLESAYEVALSRELQLRKLTHEKQKLLPVTYKGTVIESGFRLDFLVNGQIVVELKAVEKSMPLFATQVLTYLKLGGYPLGLLINFNVPRLVDGIERMSNNAPGLSAASPSTTPA